MPDNYNPNQTVAPNTGSSDNLLSARASPEAFGSQVAQATQKLGGTFEDLGKQGMDVATIRQGQLNETAIANAETQGNVQLGQIEGEFKSLRGMAAVNAHDEAVNKVQQVRQNLLSSLPNDAARRGFNQLFARTEGFTLRDFGNYKATQIKQADTESTLALQEQTIDQASRYSIASDDNELGFVLGTVKDTAQHLAVNQGWDLNTEEGKTVYNKFYDLARGKVWENSIKTLAFDPVHGDIAAAVDRLQNNKDSMPIATYAKLSQELAAPYRSVKTRDIANNTLGVWDDKYQQSITAPPSSPKVWKGAPYQTTHGIPSVDQLTDKFIQQESGGKGSNLGQIQPGTWAQYAHPGEQVSNPADNKAVTSRILQDYAKKYNGDLSRVAVAYFSGPGNVAPEGSPNPWMADNQDSSGKTVSSYVSDITGGMAQDAATVGGKGTPVYYTKAEFYEQHYGEIVQDARNDAERLFHDPRIADEAASRAEQHISEIIKTENEKKAADTELIRRTVFGEGNNGQMITNINQLENGAPEIRDAWHRLELTNPLASEALKNKVLTANSRGKQLTYGTDFWKHYEDMVSGKVKTVSDLYTYVGADRNSPLTNTGISQLAKELQLSNSPEGQAFLHSEKQYFEQLRADIVGGLNITNKRGEDIFQRAMIQALPKIQAGRAEGKSAGELFDKDSPDYVGGYATYDQRDMAARQKDMVTILNPMPMSSLIPQPKAPFDIKTIDAISDKAKGIDSIKKALQDKSMTYDDAATYLMKRGWGTPNVPEVQGR